MCGECAEPDECCDGAHLDGNMCVPDTDGNTGLDPGPTHVCT